MTDRPRLAFRRRPAKGAAIPPTRCLPPPRPRAVERIAPPAFPRRPLAHAAHTFSPGWGKVPFRALQARLPGFPRPGASRERAPFSPAGNAAPGTDDPSAPAWLGRRGRSRGLIAYARSTPAAAPRRLLRPRVRGAMCRELHEPVYARVDSDSQQKKSSLNHFFYPQGYPQLHPQFAERKSRRIENPAAVSLGKSRLWAGDVEKNHI